MISQCQTPDGLLQMKHRQIVLGLVILKVKYVLMIIPTVNLLTMKNQFVIQDAKITAKLQGSLLNNFVVQEAPVLQLMVLIIKDISTIVNVLLVIIKTPPQLMLIMMDLVLLCQLVILVNLFTKALTVLVSVLHVDLVPTGQLRLLIVVEQVLKIPPDVFLQIYIVVILMTEDVHGVMMLIQEVEQVLRIKMVLTLNTLILSLVIEIRMEFVEQEQVLNQVTVSVMISQDQPNVVQRGIEEELIPTKMTNMVLAPLMEILVVIGVIPVKELILTSDFGLLRIKRKITVDLIPVKFNTYHKIQLQNYTFLSIIFIRFLFISQISTLDEINPSTLPATWHESSNETYIGP